jgi:hypothetical protein
VTINREVIGPPIPPGMKQPHYVAGAPPDGSHIGSLAPVADHAGVSQILKNRETSMLAADNVVELKRESCVLFVNQAILTAVSRSPGNLNSQRFADITGHRQ